MARFLRLVIAALFSATVLLSVAETIGCGGAAVSAQVRVANGVSAAANGTLPLLVAEYRRQGLASIREGEAAGEDHAQLIVRMAQHDARWEVVNRAWDALRLAHEAYAVAAVASRDGASPAALLTAAERLREAWCSLRAALPTGASLADVPMLTCPEVPR